MFSSISPSGVEAENDVVGRDIVGVCVVKIFGGFGDVGHPIVYGVYIGNISSGAGTVDKIETWGAGDDGKRGEEEKKEKQ